MLKSQVQNQSRLLLPKPFINNIENVYASLLVKSRSSFSEAHKYFQVSFKPSNIKAIASVTKQPIKVKGVVTVKQTISGFFRSPGIKGGLDDIQDLLGKTLLLELVSAQLDPRTEPEKPTVKGHAHRTSQADGHVKYETEFEVPPDFGEVGAIFVENEHRKEIFLQDIVLSGFPHGQVHVICGSWVHSKHDNKQKRVFFVNKSYLPSQTPRGLRRLREEELVLLRGLGQGERTAGDRIYDYDVYNDIGDPDSGSELARPILGGKQHPYPRRCRTGRPRCKKDPLSEKRCSNFYVPRDDASCLRQLPFSTETLYSLFNTVVPPLDSLFNDGIKLPLLSKQSYWKTMLHRVPKVITDETEEVLQFLTPQTMERNKFFWFRDEEFARQTLAGLNPCSIKLVSEWPLKSTLNPDVYGPSESAITTEIIEAEIGGIIKIDEAIKQKKLFILDYHDLLLPFVSEVRKIKGRALYGSRTLFFLNPDGTLRPLAIELTRPPMDGKPQWKQVFTPCYHSTGSWLWWLAKAHVLAHDSSYHQLVVHWLRAHCATEPYIIATNRQLSVMHPIYKLLNPHFRHTIDCNTLSREAIINAGGTIESSFSFSKYSMLISSVAYDQQWRFDHQALPNDLISRGMAIEDPTAPYGIKLTIEDYPFANDGLIFWDAIKQWVSDYVNHCYPDPSLVISDQELQSWWTEIRTVGHGDKKDEPWWPELKTPNDLIEIITTIIWVTSGYHAAVNLGEYAGYSSNRPTIATIKMPTEDPTDEEWKLFMDKPYSVLFTTASSKLQARRVHSPDEDYIGKKMEPVWAEDPVIKAAFDRFSRKLMELEGIIDKRNADKKLRNRNGAGIMPYEPLKPFSDPGVTGKGVPNSIYF